MGAALGIPEPRQLEAMSEARVASVAPSGSMFAEDAAVSVEPRRPRVKARPSRGLKPSGESTNAFGAVPLVAVATWVLGVVVGYIVGVRRGRKHRDDDTSTRCASARTRTPAVIHSTPRAPTPPTLTRRLSPLSRSEEIPPETTTAATSPLVKRRAANAVKSPPPRASIPLSPLPRIGDHSAGTPLRSPVMARLENRTIAAGVAERAAAKAGDATHPEDKENASPQAVSKYSSAQAWLDDATHATPPPPGMTGDYSSAKAWLADVKDAKPETGWTEGDFRRWCSMKLGDGSSPVFWCIQGDLFEYPSGKLLAKVEGIDVARCVTEEDGDVCHQLSRKLFVFRDPVDGTVMKQFDGKPVTHIQYPYQHVTYRRNADGGPVTTEVAMGAGKALTRMAGNAVEVRRIDGGAKACFTCPVFLDLDTDQGRYEAYENYDYFDDRDSDGDTNRRTHRCVWTRFGPAAPMTEEGVLHALAWRVDRWRDVPERIRKYVEREAPTWKDAPRDLDEIKRLQREVKAPPFGM